MEFTVFERGDALVGDLELERSQERGWIIQNADVGDVDSAHCIKSQADENDSVA